MLGSIIGLFMFLAFCIGVLVGWFSREKTYKLDQKSKEEK